MTFYDIRSMNIYLHWLEENQNDHLVHNKHQQPYLLDYNQGILPTTHKKQKQKLK